MAHGDERVGSVADPSRPDPDATVIFPAVILPATGGPPSGADADTVVLAAVRPVNEAIAEPIAGITAEPVAMPAPAKTTEPDEPAKNTEPARTTEPGEPRRGSVLRHSAVMASGSLVSRVTGFLRTAVIAAALGGALVGNAYTTAQFLPGMIYELLLGGILASVVVPLLVRARTRDDDGGNAYVQRLLTLAVLALGATTLLAVAAAPLLTVVLASDSTAATRDLITTLGYLILPTIFFYGLAAILGAVLNSRERFGAPMWTPILNNLVVIGTFGVYIAMFGAEQIEPERMTTGRIMVIGLGTCLGILIQAIGLWPALRRADFRWKWRFDFRQLGLRELGRLGGWAFCYVAVSQLGLLVLIGLANQAAAKDPAAAGPLIYNNTYLLLMMAHGVIAVSIITAMLPRMSKASAEGRYDDFTDDLSRGTRMSAVVLAPVAVGYAVLAQPIAVTLFRWGAFTSEDALATSLVLLVAAFALVPFSVSQLYTFAFYALPDTRTPALLNIPVVGVRIGVQVGLAAVVAPVLIAAGLMIGNAVSFVLAAIFSGLLLRRRVGPIGLRRILVTFGKTTLAGLGAFVVGWGVVELLRRGLGEDKIAALIQLAVGGTAIVVAYGVLALVLRMREVSDVVRLLRRTLGR